MVITLSFPKECFSYFIDDFTGNSLDSSTWQSYANAGNISVSGDKVTLSRSSNKSKSFPYIYSKNDIFPSTGSFSVHLRYKYLNTGNFGTGITITTDDAPANGVDPGSNIPKYITISVWQAAPAGLYSQELLCNENGTGCNQLEFLNPFTKVSDFESHTLTIDYLENGQYLVFKDGSSTPLFVSALNQKRPKKIWMGNPLAAATFDDWASFEIDYIKVVPLDFKPPVILIPGFGASWDVGAILSGTGGTDWQIPSFIKNYDGIIESLKKSGYVLGTDLFVFPYDWRKPLSNLADDLKSFIDSKNLTGKVDIVGHSMGGLVARSYGQKYGVTKVDKILTVGSPHLGVIDMYGLWEGAKIWNGNWWQNTLLEIATEVNKNQNEIRVDSLRRVSPSVIDLFPTFSFLVSNNGLMGVDTMIQKNTTLKNYNFDVTALENVVTPFWSDDINSTRVDIKVTERSSEDIAENRWVDGRPIEGDPFGKTSGDGTVTKDSAIGPFGPGEKLTGWHGDLISSKENIDKIFTKLGLDTANTVSSETDSRINSFVAILRSPGTVEVCNRQLTLCDTQLGGITFPEYKLFILPGYYKEDLVIRVKASGLGVYKLHIGDIDESPDWITYDGNLKTDTQIDFYGVTKSGNEIVGTFDDQPPTINVNSPQATNYFSNNLPILDYEVTDNWDKNPETEISGWSQELGKHILKIKVTDDAGNQMTKEAEYQIVADIVAPTVSITSPKPGFYQHSSLSNLAYSVIDDWDENPSLDITGWSTDEGVHSVKVSAKDSSGNTGSDSVEYWVDDTPPMISITSPLATTYTTESLPKLQYTVSDNLDTVPTGQSSGWSTTEGKHTVTVTGTDAAGNTSNKSVTYTIENHPNNKEMCKKDLWKRFRFLGFKNQGDCVSFVERLLHPRIFFKFHFDNIWDRFWFDHRR